MWTDLINIYCDFLNYPNSNYFSLISERNYSDISHFLWRNCCVFIGFYSNKFNFYFMLMILFILFLKFLRRGISSFFSFPFLLIVFKIYLSEYFEWNYLNWRNHLSILWYYPNCFSRLFFFKGIAFLFQQERLSHGIN